MNFPGNGSPENLGWYYAFHKFNKFEQSNVEYIQFWVLDPYHGNSGDVADPNNTGKIVFNLGGDI